MRTHAHLGTHRTNYQVQFKVQTVLLFQKITKKTLNLTKERSSRILCIENENKMKKKDWAN